MSAKHKRVEPEWPIRTPARIAFVADAPDDEASFAGRPFVGSAGRVFNQLLSMAGVERAEHHVTYAFDFPALTGDIEKEFFVGSKEIAAGAEALLAREPFGKRYLRKSLAPNIGRLTEELARVAPTVIVPMGPAALWMLTGQRDIMATRGSLLPAKYIAPGTKLVPTLTPAHVMAEWKMFHVVANDIEKALRESDHPGIKLPRRELWLAPTLGDLAHFKRSYLDGADLISCDIETGWKQMTCIGFAPDRHRAIVVPFVDLRKPSRNYWPTPADELEALEWVREVLEGDTPKLFQNGPYDVFWLWDRYRMRVRNYRHDTRLIHHALYPELPKSLEFMGGTYATQGPWKLMRPGRADKRDE